MGLTETGTRWYSLGLKVKLCGQAESRLESVFALRKDVPRSTPKTALMSSQTWPSPCSTGVHLPTYSTSVRVTIPDFIFFRRGVPELTGPGDEITNPGPVDSRASFGAFRITVSRACTKPSKSTCHKNKTQENATLLWHTLPRRLSSHMIFSLVEVT